MILALLVLLMPLLVQPLTQVTMAMLHTIMALLRTGQLQTRVLSNKLHHKSLTTHLSSLLLRRPPLVPRIALPLPLRLSTLPSLRIQLRVNEHITVLATFTDIAPGLFLSLEQRLQVTVHCPLHAFMYSIFANTHCFHHEVDWSFSADICEHRAFTPCFPLLCNYVA
jgi:hypothetical protein